MGWDGPGWPKKIVGSLFSTIFFVKVENIWFYIFLFENCHKGKYWMGWDGPGWPKKNSGFSVFHHFFCKSREHKVFGINYIETNNYIIM